MENVCKRAGKKAFEEKWKNVDVGYARENYQGKKVKIR